MPPTDPNRPVMTLDWPDGAMEEMAALLAKGHPMVLYQFAFDTEPLSVLVTFSGPDQAILFRGGWRDDQVVRGVLLPRSVCLVGRVAASRPGEERLYFMDGTFLTEDMAGIAKQMPVNALRLLAEYRAGTEPEPIAQDLLDVWMRRLLVSTEGLDDPRLAAPLAELRQRLKLPAMDHTSVTLRLAAALGRELGKLMPVDTQTLVRDLVAH